MSKLTDFIEAGSAVIKEVGKQVGENKEIQKILFGTYTDGQPRSLSDAIDGEIISPEDRLAITKRLKKNEKKKKKKEKKGKKYAKIDLSKLAFMDDISEDEYDE